MTEWVMAPLRRYADFEGRSSRGEFWKWTLVFYLALTVLVVLMFLGQPYFGIARAKLIFGILAAIVFMGGLLPTIAIQVRRLHDTNRSGYWLLGSIGLNFVDNVIGRLAEASGSPGTALVTGGASLIYSVVLLVFYCLRGSPGENDYGPSPHEQQDLEQLARDFQ